MKRALLFVVFYSFAAPLVFLTSLERAGTFRIELGAADESYRRGPVSSWGRPYEDHGPFRIRRGERYMTYFAARMAFDGAQILVPDVVRGGDAELSLRMHRYGEPGIIRVFANGVGIGEVEYREDSYPWDVRRFEIPESFFGSGPLLISLQSLATDPKGRLRDRAIAGLDWVEIAPEAPARLRLTTGQWLFTLLIPLLVYFAVRCLVSRFGAAELAALATLAVTAWGYSASAGSAAAACSRLWLAFPLATIIWVVLKLLRVPSSAKLASGFALVLLSASTVIFWPDHLPPDVRPHMRQIRRIEVVDWRSDAVLEIASSYGKDGRTLSLGSFHPDADYIAPYSLASYIVVQGFRRGLDEPRFLIEYLAILCAGMLWLMTVLLARLIASERLELAPVFAAVLFACDLSTWHHASRAHMPALFGQMFLVAAILYLVANEREIFRPRRMIGFAIFSMAAALAYSATLLHFVSFIAWLTFFELLAARSLRLRREAWSLLAASVAGTLGAVAVFYRHFVGAGGDKAALFRAEGYVAPATFFFLRNQVRDTVRVLSGGYPLWWALAVPAYAKLEAWTRGPFARRVVWAWTAAFLTFVVLKDPVFFPRLLLQAKEHLFFASLLCVLGGLTLARLAQAGVKGKLAVALALVVAAVFRIGDYVQNADMIHPPS